MLECFITPSNAQPGGGSVSLTSLTTYPRACPLPQMPGTPPRVASGVAPEIPCPDGHGSWRLVLVTSRIPLRATPAPPRPRSGPGKGAESQGVEKSWWSCMSLQSGGTTIDPGRCSKDDDGETPAELGDAGPLSKKLQNEGGELGDSGFGAADGGRASSRWGTAGDARV